MGGLASTATALAAAEPARASLLIPLVLLAGAAGGAVWGAIPGVFKAYFNVNEILSTIMLNLVAVQIMNWLLAGPMVDKSQNSTYGLIPETKLLPRSSWLPILIPNTQLHLGVLIAVIVAVGVWVLIWRTSFGFRVQAVGFSRDASQYAGMPVKRTMTLAMTISGAMCGLGGALLVFGSVSHRMVTDGSLTGFTGSDGFNGIVVALFGALNPLWSIISAFLFGGLIVGGDVPAGRDGRAGRHGHRARGSRRRLRRLARVHAPAQPCDVARPVRSAPQRPPSRRPENRSHRSATAGERGPMSHFFTYADPDGDRGHRRSAWRRPSCWPRSARRSGSAAG